MHLQRSGGPHGLGALGSEVEAEDLTAERRLGELLALHVVLIEMLLHQRLGEMETLRMGTLEGQLTRARIEDGRGFTAFGADVLDRRFGQEGNRRLARGELLGVDRQATPEGEKQSRKGISHQLSGFPASIQVMNRAMEQLSSFPDGGIRSPSPGGSSIRPSMASANRAMSACSSNAMPAEGVPPE